MKSRLSMTALLFASALLAAPTFPPVEQPGALVIVGGGKVPTAAREEFFKLAGGEKARIVVIPTASIDADKEAEGEGFLKQWKDLKPASVVLLHSRDKAKANSPEFVKPLKEATAVWFSGGDQTRITAAYHGTLAEKEFHEVLKRGGVIGGTSAGAAIMSDLMIEGGQPAKTGSGFGFLKGIVIDQHFSERKRQPRLAKVLEDNPGYAGLGIDEATAVVVKGRQIRVIGEGTVTASWSKSSTKAAKTEVQKDGGEFDLFQICRAAHFRSLKAPFPDATAKTPEVPKGALVIVGGAGLPKTIRDKIFELSGGTDVPVVVIPTAQEDRLANRHPEVELFRKLGCKDVTVLHTRDRKVADDPKFSECLLKAKIVWFGGGRQWRFVDSYEGTLTEKRFHEVLARGGVIAGSSAGASIQSEYMPRGHPLGNTVMATEGYERGFGFLPGCAVDQHFFARKRTGDMTELMQLYPQLLGIGIDEATAIVVRGSVAEVVGATKVGFYDTTRKLEPGQPDYIEVKTGSKFDLKKRQPIK